MPDMPEDVAEAHRHDHAHYAAAWNKLAEFVRAMRTIPDLPVEAMAALDAIPTWALPVPLDYLIWSHEHSGWWQENERGYTRVLEFAGRYADKRSAQIVENAAHGWGDVGTPPPEVRVFIGDLVGRDTITIAGTVRERVAQETARAIAARVDTPLPPAAPISAVITLAARPVPDGQ